MNHFFINEGDILKDRALITGENAHHIKNVLRLKPGEEISLSVADGSLREYRCAISGYIGDEVECEILFVKDSDVELPCKVTLFQGLPKGDKMDTVVQKAVELGAHAIVPVGCERSIVRLDENKAKKKIARWQAIAEGAARQSQRGVIPEVLPLMDYKDALAMAKGKKIFVPYEKAEDMNNTRYLMSGISPGNEVAVFIGPEGGFSQRETELAREAGAYLITLGKRILRTETAGMTFLSWIVYLLDES